LIPFKARKEETRNAYRVLVGKLLQKGPLGRCRDEWGDDIKMDFQGIGSEGVDWIHLAQIWRAIVKMTMNLRVP
jgi:hypothetical protein